MKTTTDMQLVPISKLVPYVNNARTHSPEQVMKLRSSLREFGFINPIIIDRDYGIIAGHGRLLAAKEEGHHRGALCLCGLPDRGAEKKPTSSPITAWRWTQVGMKSSSGWKSRRCRGEAFDVSLTALTRRNWLTCSRTGAILTRKMTITT